jgi:predicted GIY-YIG superfamily endonuclease
MARRLHRTTRDTYNYTLYAPFGMPIYHGITNNPQRRIREHRKSGKYFTDYSISTVRSRTRADRDETRAIHQHQDEHWEAAPLYNIAKVRPKSWRL